MSCVIRRLLYKRTVFLICGIALKLLPRFTLVNVAQQKTGILENFYVGTVNHAVVVAVRRKIFCFACLLTGEKSVGYERYDICVLCVIPAVTVNVAEDNNSVCVNKIAVFINFNKRACADFIAGFGYLNFAAVGRSGNITVNRIKPRRKAVN